MPCAAQVTLYGGIVAACGATFAISGSGKKAVSQLAAISLTSKLPSGWLKDALSEGISDLANAVLPEIKSCQ